MMKIYDVYEDFINILGERYKKRIGSVEAKNITSAINKAKKQFKCDEWGRKYWDGRRCVSGVDGMKKF